MRSRLIPTWSALILPLVVSGTLAQTIPQTTAQRNALLMQQAAKGDAKAQYNLGWMYEDGKGVPQDYAQAAFWCRKAAAQGYPPAEFALAGLYESGVGVPKDYAVGVRWLSKAAEHGYAAAQFNLANLYLAGQEGLPKDYVQAYFWLDIAASGKPETMEGLTPRGIAQYRDNAALRLTRTVLLQTQERARKWLEDHSARANP